MDQTSVGIILDWLSIIDSEITNMKPIMQRELLFTHSNEDTSYNYGNKNAFLISLLAHQTKVTTLQDCLTWMLNANRKTEK